MTQILQTEFSSELTGKPAGNALPPADLDVVVRHKADLHWTLVDDDGQTLARCSLWWNETPAYRDHRVGLIGHFGVRGGSAGRQLLRRACEKLAAQGCTLAVGPMDGSIWRPYRLVTEFGSEPPFFLEPCNPENWPGLFLESGFRSFAEYFSAENTNLGNENPSIARIARRIESSGVSIRRLDRRRFDEDLSRIYSIAKACFRDSLLYTEMPEREFLDLYRPLEDVVRYELVLIAEQGNTPVGFVFAVPDLLQAKRGATIDTLIVKTLGVLPGMEFAGLGLLLLERIRSSAHQLGYHRLIHALVRDAGHLRRLSGRSARPIRRYTLFAKELRT